MESRTLQLLEFPKVLQALAARAVSEPGALSCLAIRPLASIDEIRLQGRLADQAGRFASAHGLSLRAFPDLDGLFRYLDEKTDPLDLDALFALSQVLLQAKAARDVLMDGEDGSLEDLRAYLCAAPWPQLLAGALARCMNVDGQLRDEASPELAAIRADIRAIHQQCTKKAKDFILSNDLSRYLQDDYITLASDRYVLPLKANFKGRLQGIVHDYSQTGETCYFEPILLVELNNRLQELKKEEGREERKILEYLTDLLRRERGGVQGGYDFLVRLDVLLAKAKLGADMGGRTLDVEEGAPLRLNHARHPLLALASESVRPVDIELREGDRALLISGGNAGGKTVALKTVGLSAAMAYSGLPVCAGPGSALPFLPRICIIMGDEQSLEGQVSTFTAQVRNISRVWAEVDRRTLFLLDEFGAGTDPTQGAALAQAVLDRLIERGATVFAATHFPALKAWALSTDKVRAASVLFDPANKKPLYQLAYEIVGASIALDVARDNGLPPEILETAERYLLLDGTDSSAVLARLNELAVERMRAVEELERERGRYEAKRSELAEKFRAQQGKLLEDLRARSQAVVREWKEGRAGRKKTLEKLGNLREELTLQDVAGEEAAPKPKPFSFADVEVGSRVLYLAWGKPGAVLEKDERKEQVKLDLDGVSMWVKGADVGPLEGGAANAGGKGGKGAKGAQGVAGVASSSALTLTLDLRGKRADEAVGELERFLDAAILRGAGGLEIVHGRGTGALRREVHEVLKRFPGVDSFALANEDRGGDGMTDVVLK
jgi:DNA mismatch repair protein MutS2